MINSDIPLKNCRVFLFNDCVLLTEPQKRSIFDSANSVPKLKPVEIVDLNNAVLLAVDFPETEFRVRAPSGLVIFQAKNWPEKEAWMDDISTCINKRSENSSLPKSQSTMLTAQNPLQIPELLRFRTRTFSQTNLGLGTPKRTNSKKFSVDPLKAPVTRSTTMNYHPHNNSISRNLTLPKIGIKSLFQKTYLEAPEVRNSTRFSQKLKRIMPRSVSTNSFFAVKTKEVKEGERTRSSSFSSFCSRNMY